MPLLNRGRLSVQRVSQECWDVIRQMAERGGWENTSVLQKAGKRKAKLKSTEDLKTGKKDSRGATDVGDVAEQKSESRRTRLDHIGGLNGHKGRKRKLLEEEATSTDGPRRKSARAK